MRYVQKINPPQFFIDNTQGITKWEEYPVSKKPLKKYMLENEQNFLCIYCESKVEINSSHIEHIKPKANNMFPQLVFSYDNIVVSCNGNCHAEDESHYSCGHIKENEYDDIKFLNPTIIKNIRDYFKYDFDDYLISSSNENIEKAQYMIHTLHLNDGGLPKGREKALENFIKRMKNIPNIKVRKEKMKKILDKENIAFISFLRFKYKAFL